MNNPYLADNQSSIAFEKALHSQENIDQYSVRKLLFLTYYQYYDFR